MANLSPKLLQFPTYSKQEINDIITSRLQNVTNSANNELIIKPVAIKFLAGKIASISGDIRKALDVCRRAIELAELEYTKQLCLSPAGSAPSTPSGIKPIDLPQLVAIFNQIYSSRVNSSLSQNPTNKDNGQEDGEVLPLQQKVLMATLLLMTRYGKKCCKEVSLGKLQETVSRICRRRHLATLDVSETASLCSLLEARGFIAMKKKSGKNVGIRDTLVSLRIDEKEVEQALKDKALLNQIVKDKDCISN